MSESRRSLTFYPIPVSREHSCSYASVLSASDLGKAANFPYATINPEEARIPVPDTRFEWLCDSYKPASRVPAFLTCIDIAGLTAVRLCHMYLDYLH
jgi:hypothetical protein